MIVLCMVWSMSGLSDMLLVVCVATWGGAPMVCGEYMNRNGC